MFLMDVIIIITVGRLEGNTPFEDTDIYINIII
jgi:hypothetical protein